MSNVTETKAQFLTREKVARISQANDLITRLVPKGTRVKYVVMSRGANGGAVIRYYVALNEKHYGLTVLEITNAIGYLSGNRVSDKGVHVSGGGMDLAKHALSGASFAVYGDQYALIGEA